MAQTEHDKMMHQRAGSIERRLAQAAQHERNPQIQEAEFTRVFLPMFVGGGEYINQDAWVAVAGSVNNEVDVFRGQEYLYTLPALAIPIRSEISSRSQNGRMGDNWMGTGLNAADDPGSIESVMSIDAKGKQVALASTAEEHMARWDEVFKRYGLDYRVIRADLHERKTGQKVNPNIIDQSDKALATKQVELDDNGDYEDY
ncbi:hypothetical protein RAY_237 [Erwinia phage vB_EamM_RAY]|uniref:Uncharacterized protein n=10 Tax=Agricanvirus TaxID=1984776 RepID=A0A173GEF8_9CAUD|nr:hypothetical protein Ea357_235 [Erwinia phage Ea35-70]YP_009605386.1 hypothetical protein FDH97_gp243 [Erwinia phage vB_EamM_Deimos-Minion]YP_009605703.1 hypothetical protein FDH98_gp281 [Erwinia phage vB_EamM_RAY]YP_009606025.1 hypothetical protein FDH99_gp284 [Erwinia phage vB_EamM_Simmy50]YP_009606346.1 hypothetical protein FDI00_gp240 [Erwinia phage vB_EamM_Special G]YP_009621979.1 hypothetical protein FDJ23_gp238 [Erwinia phage vB_EamM_Desertfox]AUG86026.1 hypothetical protein BOSOLAP